MSTGLSRGEKLQVELDARIMREHVMTWYGGADPVSAHCDTFRVIGAICVHCDHDPFAHDRQTGACFFSPGTLYEPPFSNQYFENWAVLSYSLTLAETPDLSTLAEQP